jgi:hypothetical protein
MKKVLFIIGIAILALGSTSCKKENKVPNQSTTCYCGEITNIEHIPDNGSTLIITVINDCSGNLKDFYIPFNQEIKVNKKWCDNKFEVNW